MDKSSVVKKYKMQLATTNTVFGQFLTRSSSVTLKFLWCISNFSGVEQFSKQQKRKISAKTALPGLEFSPIRILLSRKFGTEKVNQVKG